VDRPIVLCGLGRMGTRVLQYLRAADLPVVVIDNSCSSDDPRLQGARLVSGDCRHQTVLEQAGVADADGVLILTRDDHLNVSTTLAVRALNPKVRIVLRLFNQDLISRLGQALPNVYPLSTSLLTAPILALTAVAGQGLAAFDLERPPTPQDDSARHPSHASTEGRRQVAELTIQAGSVLVGRPIRDVTAAQDALVIAHLPADGPERFLREVDRHAILRIGDRLVVCSHPRALTALLAESSRGDAPDLLWAAWHRRMARVLRRTLAEMDRAVLICTAVLILVILASTLALRVAVKRTIPDALFRTISVIATGASMYDDDLIDAPGMKVYLSVLRIVGAALTAAFTAIVTNYLIRARLGGAFEVGRVPDGGHVIICGLGAIGYRVTEELRKDGEQVVVIERDPNNRLVRAARRLGAAVMIADAGVSEVLREARAATAHAVIAATDDDLTNLAVSLLVREINPRHRVILLLEDPSFAEKLREAANVQLALSVPLLAAPAFLAALYGDRVLGVFRVRDRLFAVIDLVVQGQDPLLPLSLQTIAIDYRLLPVAVVPFHGSSAGPAASTSAWRESRPGLPLRLTAGDRLVAIIALPDLERLLRRQPCTAAYAVDVTGFLLPLRPWLAGLVRTRLGCSAADAERALDSLPLRLGDHLTLGQAEDLLDQLGRQRVAARLVSLS
jgi:Trk K+ transport system NAD-binding subunit